MTLIIHQYLEKILKFISLKCLKTHFNYPRWLKKILKFTCQSKFSEFSRFSLRQIKFPEFSRFSRLLDTLYYEFMLIGQMLCYITPIFRKGPFLWCYAERDACTGVPVFSGFGILTFPWATTTFPWPFPTIHIFILVSQKKSKHYNTHWRWWKGTNYELWPLGSHSKMPNFIYDSMPFLSHFHDFYAIFD